MRKPRVGVSQCLLGDRVRYDGEHKRCGWVVEKLAKYVTLVPVCPEVAMGLGVPRPSMRLVDGGKTGTRLVTNAAGVDLTEKARSTFDRLERKLGELDGFIFKKNSPSCGTERVKLFGKSGKPRREGVGLFAGLVRERRPDLVVIEEGRLTDPEQRENFVVRLHAWTRLRDVPARASAIQEFHRRHELMLLEHSPAAYRRLGPLVGNEAKLPPSKVLARYRVLFMRALSKPPTKRTRTAVLEHVLGFLRGKADKDDRARLAESIRLFDAGEVPFLTPLALASRLVRKHRVAYLEEQVFFSPVPRGLQQ
nr:hypothetical protein [uncultured bacterium]